LALSGGTIVCCWTVDETGAEMLRTILLADISHVMKRLAHSQRWREMGVSLMPTYSTAHTDDTGRREEAFFSDFCVGEWDQTPHPDILINVDFSVTFLLCQERLVAFRETLTSNGEIEKKRQVERVGWKYKTTRHGTYHFRLTPSSLLASNLHNVSTLLLFGSGSMEIFNNRAIIALPSVIIQQHAFFFIFCL
jgi:hypothetical protein